MTNLIEKARAGRTKALQSRAARRITQVNTAEDKIRAAAQRRNSVPLFISTRARPEAPAYLH
ncbi:MAG: hypothetical protein WBV71_00990 [Roseobacter sp.]|jgi:hypothetical protein